MKLDLRKDVIVAIVAAICTTALVIISNVRNIQMEFIYYLIPMFVLVLYFIITREKKKSKNFFMSSLFWSILIFIVAAIVYVLKVFNVI